MCMYILRWLLPRLNYRTLSAPTPETVLWLFGVMSMRVVVLCFSLICRSPLYAYATFFTLSTVDGYSGCIRFGAIVNKAAVYISCICLLVDISSHSTEIMPKNEIARSWDWLSFSSCCQLPKWWDQSTDLFQLLRFLVSTWHCLNRCVGSGGIHQYLSGFNLHFPCNKYCSVSYQMLTDYLHIIFCEMPLQVFCLPTKLDCLVF